MTAFPRMKGRRLASIIGAAALVAGLATVPAVAANAATSPPDSSSSPTLQTLRQHVSRVQQWSEGHQAPFRYANPSEQQFLDYSEKLADYWQQLPWSDFYGQYGCDVSSVDVQFHDQDGSWGDAGAQALVSFDCTDAALPVVTPDVPDDIAPPADSDQDGLPVATQALSASGSIDLAGKIGGANTCAESGSHHEVCVGMPSSGLLMGSESNDTNSTDKGHIHLGRTNGTCNAGTTVANSPTLSVGSGTTVIMYASVNPGSKWVTQWYDPNETSQVCGTY